MPGGGGGSVTVGFKYFAGVHFVLCLGPIDRITAFEVDRRRAFTGTIRDSRQRPFIRGGLFGGRGREGGISGYIDFMFGAPDQTRSFYLERLFGDKTPAYRGIVSVVLRRFWLTNNPYLKPWRFRVENTKNMTHDNWQPALRAINFSAAAESAGIYIVIDVSGAVTQGFLDAQKQAVRNILNTLKARRFGNNRVRITAMDSGRSAIVRTGDTKEKYDELIAWVDALTLGSGQASYATALEPAQQFFQNGSKDPLGSPQFEAVGEVITGLDDETDASRIIIFMAADVPTEADLTAAKAHVDAIPEVQFWAISLGDGIENDATEPLGELDNTSIDGVVVANGNFGGQIQTAVQTALSEWIDANPIHIIRDILIGPDMGGSGDAAEIGPSFAVAAQTIFDEGLGVSYLYSSDQPANEFLKEIEETIDAVVYQDRRTGLYEIKLIRDDYDPAALPLFNRDNVKAWRMNPTLEAENLPNTIALRFKSRDKPEDSSLTITDPAQVAFAGRVISIPKTYIGVSDPGVAARLGLRDHRANSNPFRSGEIDVMGDQPNIQLGDAIRLDNARLNIVDAVFRVVEIQDSDGRTPGVTLTVTEDVFSTPQTGIAAYDEGVAPQLEVPVVAAAVRFVEEAPYWFLVQALGQSEIDARLTANSGEGYLLLTSESPTPDSVNHSIAVNTGAGFTETGFTDFSVVSFTRSSLAGHPGETLFLIDSEQELAEVALGTLLRIGGEYMRVDALTPVGDASGVSGYSALTSTGGSGSYVQVTVGRGCLDTVPEAHGPDEPILFFSADASGDEVRYEDGEAVEVKLLTVAAAGTLALSSAPQDAVNMASRAFRPYAPGRLMLDGTYSPSARPDGSATLTWAHRDRSSQTASTFDDADAASIGPEAGTTYRVDVWAMSAAGAELQELANQNVGNVLTWDFVAPDGYPSGTAYFRYRVYSVRDGLESRVAPQINSEPFIAVNGGWGAGWGTAWGGTV